MVKGAGAGLGPCTFTWKTPDTQGGEAPLTPQTLVVAKFLGVSMFPQLSASLGDGMGN